MMATHETQAAQQAELEKQLWTIANDLRGNMDANEFRNYILGLIFYRFLSEKVEGYADKLLAGENVSFTEAVGNPDYEGLDEEIISGLGFYVKPASLFSTMIADIQAGEFSIENLQIAVQDVEASTVGTDSEDDFRGLLEDLDLSSSRLGNTVAKRSESIAKVILKLADISFTADDSEIDILGNAYEYLIGQFAAYAGKKAGEFYTPQQI